MASDTRDITPKLLERYYEAGKLGTLSVEIPNQGGMTTDLTTLYRVGTGMSFFEYALPPEDITSIVVFGSTLYRHQDRTKVELKEHRKASKKFPFVKKEKTIEETIEPYRMPNDLDILFLTNKAHEMQERIDEGRVDTKKMEYDGYGYRAHAGNRDLHIAYRSVDQLIEGLEEGDSVSTHILRHGLPIIGKQPFEKEVLGKILGLERDQQHDISWYETLDGTLKGSIR